MSYPDTPGWKGEPGGAGQKAAIDFEPKLARREAEAYAALKAIGEATAFEVAEQIGRHWFHVAPRLSGLKKKGLAVAVERRGVSAFGRPATIYRPATAEERAAFQADDGGDA